MADAMERLRRRLAILIDERSNASRFRQKALARHLNKTEAWLTNVLNGRRGLRLVDLDTIADFFHVPPSELIRAGDDPLVEVSPSELALLKKMRRSSPSFREAVWTLAGLSEDGQGTTKSRRKTVKTSS